MKKIIYLFILTLFFLSCNSNKELNNKSLKICHSNVLFNIGYPRTTGGLFSYRGNEFKFYADFITRNKISLYTIKGKLVYTLSVKELMTKNNCKFISACFISPDSIALLTKYSNNVFIVNQEGKLLYKKDYSPLLLKGYQFAPPFQIDDKMLRVTLHFNDPDFHINGTIEDKRSSRKRSKESYKLVCDTNFFSVANPVMQIDSMYNRFSTYKQLTSEGNHFTFLGKENIFTSGYSDTIYIFNLMGQLIKTKAVFSKYYNTKMVPITYNDFANNPSSLNINYRKYGHISEILWDKYRAIYYCFVQGKFFKDGRIPFSIIIYDKYFNKLEEINMGGKKYYLSGFVAKNGLYLLKRSGNLNNDITNRKYEILCFK